MKTIIHIFLVFAAPLFVAGQAFQNLDLETIDEETGLPQNWYIVEEQGCKFQADLTHYRGKRSLKLSSHDSSSVCSATILSSLSSELFQGKNRIKIIAHIKSPASANQISIVAKQLSSSAQEIKNRVLGQGEKDESRGWRTLVYEQQIDSSAVHLAFGIKGFLKDSLWVDGFEVYIDDSQIPDPPAPEMDRPTGTQVHWLKENCIPLDSISINTQRFLNAGLNHANVVALGEVTHGSREIYEVKHSIVKFLVEKRGFGLLAMEMDMAEAETLNHYVLNNIGDPQNLLMQISYWPWRTEEFLNLLKWMNSYNRAHDQKIMITGFDIPISTMAIDSVLAFSLKYDKGLYSKVDSLRRLASTSYDEEEINKFTTLVENTLKYFRQQKRHLASLTNQSVCDRIEYKIVSLKQTAMYYYYQSIRDNFGFRDQCMAENISWLIKQNTATNIILWAHNAHISKGSDYSAGMGEGLKQRYSFFSVGFMLGNGYFNATSESRTIKPHPLKVPVSDSYEFYFTAANSAACYLDLTNLNRIKENAWLFESRRLRFIGSSVSRYQFAKVNLIKNFDAVVFIPNSSPSRIITPK